VVCVQLSL